ncbi:MAG: hypothetical protein H8E74_10920, partial [Gammaproteobacteria bacterium]|nr:hypothetical protein [Gammaproteobacteria bacterium]
MKKIILISIMLLSSYGFISTQANIKNPLPVQMESKYVTDRSLWGSLIFDRNKVKGSHQLIEDKQEIMDVIETYHRHWLDRNNKEVSELLDEEIIRFRDGRITYGLNNTFNQIVNESRGERPSGYASSMQLEIVDMQIHSEINFSFALYSLGIKGGARWEYSDLATVFQIFHKVDNEWKIIGHIENFRLDNPKVKKLPDTIPNRRSAFNFDFVYPVKDLQRAIDFYSPLLGSPEIITSTTASFRAGDSYFELESEPIDDRIGAIYGSANGYGIINVDSLSNIRDQIIGLIDINMQTKACGLAVCLITEDTSGNIVIWREYKSTNTSPNKKPTIQSLNKLDQPPVFSKLIQSVNAWITNDYSRLLAMQSIKALWIDDAIGVAEGKEQIKLALQSRWSLFDKGANGINADLKTSNFQIRNIGNRQLVTLEMSINLRASPKRSFDCLLTQIWKKEGLNLVLESTFIAQKNNIKNMPVSTMDYTAYPVYDLGKAGRFYKDLLGSEPYR